MDTLAGVLSGLWPGAAAGGRAIPATTSSHIDEVLWGNADKCERLRSMFKAHAARVKGAGRTLRGCGFKTQLCNVKACVPFQALMYKGVSKVYVGR